MTSWSITTDVSRSPLVGSVIDALVDHSVEICTKSICIDAGCTHCCIGKGCSRHEATRPNRTQLRHRGAVTGDYDRSPGLYLAKDGCGLIPKLPLSDRSVHFGMCSTCRTS